MIRITESLTMSFIRKLLISATIAFVSGCGGGGGNASSVGSGETTPPPVPLPVAADFIFTLDKLSVVSSTNEVSTLTVTAVDANRNVLKDIPVSVSVDAGGIFTPGGASITNASGVFTGTISMGADKTSRVLKATILVSGITKIASVTVTGTTEAKADYIYELDKTVVFNTGSDKALLTVTALDEMRNVLAGVPVTVSLDSGGVFTRTGGLTTDAQGKFTGSITIGADKSDRTINATITAANITKVASVVVSGSTLAASLVSATPAPGASVVLNLSATDKSGVPVVGAVLNISGITGLSGTVTTDTLGVATKSFFAPLTPGNYIVEISGLGVKTSRTLQVINPAGSGIPAAIGTPSSKSLSPVPSTIAPNLVGSTTNRLRLNAKFIDAFNTGIENMRVRFEIVPPALGSGESISTGLGTVYSDSTGTAAADYISGTRPSPTNGVVIRACYKTTDFLSSSDCPAFVQTTLTVAGTPLSISISTDNKLTTSGGGIAYVKKFLIQVNDAAGVAVPDAVVSVSVDITHFGKGIGVAFNKPYPSLNLNLQDPSKNTSAPDDFTLPTTVSNIWCANEDKSRNGFLDAGEDRNANGTLEPRKAEIIVSYVSGNRTDVSGQLLAQISYGQNSGTWLAYTLRATTGVDGSEGDASKSFITDVLEADVDNGSFRTSPYGQGRCVDAN